MTSIVSSDSISSENPKLQRTIIRFKSKVSSKEYYEAHQTLRSLINRSVKGSQYQHALDLIYYGSLILMEHEQFASAADLLHYMIEILNLPSCEISENSENFMGRLLTLLNKFPANEPSFHKIDVDLMNWSSSFNNKSNSYKFGNPVFHDLFGLKYFSCTNFKNSEDLNNYYQNAIYHFMLGNPKNCFEPMSELIYSWILDITDNFKADNLNSDSIVNLIAFPVLNYLVLQNFKDSKSFLMLIVGKLQTDYPQVFATSELAVDSEFKINFLSIKETNEQLKPLNIVNHLQLVILSIQYSLKDIFIALKKAYAYNNNDLGALMEKLGSIYFEIPVTQNTNLLQQMMSGLF